MIRTFQRAILSAAVLAVVAIVVLLLAPSARADASRLLVSSSAAGPFLDQLPEPLFAGEGPLVPGDRVRSTFWVRNGSPEPARVGLAVVNRGVGNEFEDALAVAVDVGGDHRQTGLAELPANGCLLLTTGPVLEPDAVQAVHVDLVVADLEQQVGMLQSASLDFVATLGGALGPAGQVEVCGRQEGIATPPGGDQQADPTTPDSQQPLDQCSHDVVVTLARTPTCVPTVVDAGSTAALGAAGTPGAERLGLVLGLSGAVLLFWAQRRRRRPHAPATADLPGVAGPE